MIRIEELYFDSRDNKSKIHAMKWIPEEEKPVCILQIVHGMTEHVERYNDFAVNMAEKGILVVGEDHLGHGKSIGEDGKKGYFCERDAATVLVRDTHRLKKMVQEEHPGVPYIVLGHSMGSMILRNYLCRYGTGIQAAIIMGTGMPPKPVILFGKFLAQIQKMIHDEKWESKFLDSAIFGSYNKKVVNKRTDRDWLCRDEKVVDKYEEDPMCGFIFTVNGFQTLLELVSRLHKKENLKKMPPELPVFFLSGTEDPVGGYGKGVKAVCQSYLNIGMQYVHMKLYENDRHEILNEIDKEQVYEDIYLWILSIL